MGLDLIIKATPSLYLTKTEDSKLFFTEILSQMAALCDLEDALPKSLNGFVATLHKDIIIQAGIGTFQNDINHQDALEIHQRWGKLLLDGQSIDNLPENIFITLFKDDKKTLGYIYLEGINKLTASDRHLITVLSNQISSAIQNQRLQSDLREANRVALLMLAEASEYKDEDTGEHLLRIRDSTYNLALAYGLDDEIAQQYGDAAILHDIGKMGIPDEILQKPGSLAPHEFDIIKTHPVIGESILKRNRWFLLARTCAFNHHEHWDGNGYPNGLKGKDIPLIGRIVAVTDVFDALSHSRPYKEAWPLDKVIKTILAGTGKQFDPQVINAFMSLHKAGKLTQFI